MAALVLVYAACSPAASEQTSTTQTGDIEATTTTTVASSRLPDASLLSYSLEIGTTFSYEVELNQHLEMSASGDASAMGDEELPGEAVIDLEGAAVFTYTVADGTEPGTYEISIRGEFERLNVTGTVDGVSVDEAPDFAGVEPVDVTIIVDDQGTLIVDGLEIDDPFGSVFGDLGNLGSPDASGLDPGQFFGPAFSSDEAGVGDSWYGEIETAGFGESPVVTSVTSTITATDEVDGAEVFVIETNTTTSAIELDLGEFFAGLLGAFAPDTAGGEGSAELEALMEQLKFVISIDGSKSDSTTWFDPETGVVPKWVTDGATNVVISINIPDENTGELVGFDMEMSISQQVSYRLLDHRPTSPS